ncbi:flagellar hook-length control protein FliK [Pseudomonas sp. NPDC090755]|uniref:flagellar hook-length control protein FliK n=1 Tax=Pseudomonas sp. NPDC090755 TaxID=3364481 RepID=UPI00383A08B0
MTADIGSLGSQAPTSPAPRPANPTGELLRLLQAQPGLLAPGEIARAEVVSLRQMGQDFQLLLRLTQDSGKQINVQATSSQAMPQGSQLAVSQTSSSNLNIALQQVVASNVNSLTRIDTVSMPVGSLLQGKVLTSQALPQTSGQPVQYRSLVGLLGANNGTTLTLDSPRPLAIGSLLSARVTGEQSLQFLPLSGRQDQLAITQQLGAQQNRQASLQGLLAALQRLQGDSRQPDELRASVDKLLASLPDPGQLSDPKGLARALNNSGVFLEAKLLAGLPQALAPDLKSQVTRLIAQLLPSLPGNAPFNPAIAASSLAQVMPGMVRTALGMLGQVSPRPHPSAFPLPSRLLKNHDGEDSLEHLLRLAAGALSRLQTHQLASLEQTGTTPDGALQTTWQLEIPVRTGQEFTPLQLKLQREETREQQDDPERERRDPLAMAWHIELSFDLHPLGPLQVQAQINQGKLSSQFWAERPATAQLIDSQLGNLRERLLARGLNVGDLHCHPGTPPQGPRTHLEQRWVDENA